MDTDTSFPHVIWLNLIICAWLLIVPFALPRISNTDVRWNEAVAAVVIGVCSIASVRRRAHHRILRTIVLLTGVWLTISPFHLPYPPARSGADVLIGSLVMVVTVIEMVQAGSHRLT